jgi:hypothetical protein
MRRLEFVYLTSPPFSGSTLFAFLANTHPEIATVGEMTGIIAAADPESYECSCGLRIVSCPFWSSVSDGMARRGFAFSPTEFDTKLALDGTAGRLLKSSLPSVLLEDMRDAVLRTIPATGRRLRYLVARNKALARSILEVSGKRVFLDASKSPYIIRFLRTEPDVQLRVVHLVRDVRGTSYSRLKNKGETDWNATVSKWIRMNHVIERQLGRLPTDSWIRIRYEDLCNDPVDTMNRFFEFCGVDAGGTDIDLHSQVHHIIGNRMRLQSSRQITVDESWRRELPSSKQYQAVKLAAFLHARYGYAQPGNDVQDCATLDP